MCLILPTSTLEDSSATRNARPADEQAAIHHREERPGQRQIPGEARERHAAGCEREAFKDRERDDDEKEPRAPNLAPAFLLLGHGGSGMALQPPSCLQSWMPDKTRPPAPTAAVVKAMPVASGTAAEPASVNAAARTKILGRAFMTRPPSSTRRR